MTFHSISRRTLAMRIDARGGQMRSSLVPASLVEPIVTGGTLGTDWRFHDLDSLPSTASDARNRRARARPLTIQRGVDSATRDDTVEVSIGWTDDERLDPQQIVLDSTGTPFSAQPIHQRSPK